MIAEAAGDYTIELRDRVQVLGPAKYLITGTAPREATEEDRRRVAGVFTVSEAEELRTGSGGLAEPGRRKVRPGRGDLAKSRRSL